MKRHLFCALTLWGCSNMAFAGLAELGPEQFVQAGGSDIQVSGYSVPSFVDWNNDGLNDLVIGEGGGLGGPGKVRIYINQGTASSPSFGVFSYAKSNGQDLSVPSAGCLGAFPRLVNWDGDARQDLLIGLADGTAKIFLNTGTLSNPAFGGGSAVKVGWPEVSLNVGMRATPIQVDWNNDGKLDIVAGALDGKIHVYTNCGCGGAMPPHFYYDPPAGSPVRLGGTDLVVPTGRSSPVVVDLDGDGKKDLLSGNSEGQLLMYLNVGTDASPAFSAYSLLQSAGAVIDLPGLARSRPFVTDWNNDGRLDILLGSGDGKIRLFASVPEPATILVLGLGAMGLLRRRVRTRA